MVTDFTEEKGSAIMFINQSTVAMGSRRSYQETTSWQGTTVLLYKPNQKNTLNQNKNQGQEKNQNIGKQKNTALSISKQSMDLYRQLQELRRESSEGEDKNLLLNERMERDTTREKSKDELLLETLRRLLEEIKKMNQKGKDGQSITLKSLSSQIQQSSITAAASQSSLSIAGGSGSMDRTNGVWIRQRVVSGFHQESENTAFSSMGMVKTSDGREINFNIDIEMSRSYTEAHSLFSQENVIYMDPLVINMDVGTASVSDQKFYFDLDADGKEEEISYLGKGSGFLALDKNGDGMINDGSELFGTKSGDGFADLAAYDKDGNGWIDENDEVFHHLKVWTKTEDETDRLVDLKEAGVGAIYLGKTNTQFSLNNSKTNENNAVIRSTGVFLKESGEAGTIQHVDFSV